MKTTVPTTAPPMILGVSSVFWGVATPETLGVPKLGGSVPILVCVVFPEGSSEPVAVVVVATVVEGVVMSRRMQQR